MDKIKVVYICHFSTPEIRDCLKLNSFWFGNCLRRIKGLEQLNYNDAGTWNADFIKAFEGNGEFECFVISHHLGMAHREQRFVRNGVNYVFLHENENLVGKVAKHLIGRKNTVDYGVQARRIKDIVEEVNPDIVVLCGAENPLYSSSVLEISNRPIFVILQTLLNSPKRIAMGVGNEQRRALENSIFEHAGYFATIESDVADYVRMKNPQARIFRLMFPSSEPAEMEDTPQKIYDFVFFANGLTRNKGIEDALQAFGNVKQLHPESTFCVIGDCDSDYMAYLNNLMCELDITRNIILRGHYPSKVDAMNEVMKARIVVLPGITAPFNSTVREAMFMGIPTIVYGNDVIDAINKENINIITATKEDTTDLGRKMLYALEHPKMMEIIAERARIYAQNHFSVSAIGEKLISDVKSIVGHYYGNLAIPEDFLI